MHNRVTVGPDGPLDVEILLVGQAPGDTEIAQQRPFVGPAGIMLQACVREAGLDWSRIRKTNAVSYRLKDDRAEDSDLSAEKQRVLDEIVQMPGLKVIVALGNDAMKQLVRRSGVTKYRGEEISMMLGNGSEVAVLPTFHPAYVLRRRAARPILVRDLVRAKKLAAGVPFLDPAQVVKILPEGVSTTTVAYPSCMVVAVDVETDEFDKPRLLAVGAAPSDVSVINAQDAYQAVFDVPHTWVGHNLHADEVWLRHLGIELKGSKHDTMLMAHLLNENRSMSLKKLALELLDPALWWQYIGPLLRRPATRGAISYNELAEYCANDVAATLLLYDILRLQLYAEPRLKALYTHISLPLSDVLLEMEWRGVRLDIGRARRLRDDYGRRRREISLDMDRLLGRPAGQVNYGSHPQVRKILYTELGLTPPHFTETGEGSTDEKALMKLRDQHEFVRKMREWRKVDKKDQIVESWVKRADPADIVRPRYNQTGTVTGRLSGSNPNPQNVPTDPEIRGLIIPRPGYYLVSADYKTIEMGCAAWIFEEPEMLAAYKRQMEGGEDLHTYTATRLLGRPPANKDERKKFGKTPNFGLLYQQGDRGYHEYAAKMGVEMTLEEAAHSRAQWHALYPGIRDGWQRIGQQMKMNGGNVASPSGRLRRLPEFLSGNKALVNEAWRQGCNFPVQCTAAEFTHIAAILAHEAAKPTNGHHPLAHLILHVHDSLVFEVVEECLLYWIGKLRSIMEISVPKYFETHFGVHVPIPLRVDITEGERWS